MSCERSAAPFRRVCRGAAPSRSTEGADLYRDTGIGTQVIQLSSGLAGTRETIIYMQRLAARDSATPAVREAAERIVRGCPEKDYACEARAIVNWVRAHMRFTRDGLNTETVKTPTRMLREISSAGRACLDCDDASTLIAALLLSVGHAPAFEVLGRGPVPHHVRVIDHTTGLALDPTVGEVTPTDQFEFREVYDVVAGTAPLAGLGQDVAEKSPLEKWLPGVLLARFILRLIFRRKS